MDLDLTSSTDWPENAKDFMVLDQTLRCEICKDFYKNCVITACSHNCKSICIGFHCKGDSALKMRNAEPFSVCSSASYCSYCIRNHMIVSQICPICSELIVESEIRCNRAVDSVISSFCKARSMLLNLIKTSSTVCPRNPNLCKNHDDKEPLPGSSKDTRSKSTKNAMELLRGSGSNKAGCSSSSSSSEVKELSNSREYLRAVTYKFIKPKELKELLSKYGLNTKGTKEDLVRRHKKFRALYNSECDANVPRSVSDIVKQIRDEELRCQRARAAHKSQSPLFLTHRNSNPEDIEKEREKYVNAHGNQFRALIEQARTNNMKNKALHQEHRTRQDESGSSSGFGCEIQSNLLLRKDISEPSNETARTRFSSTCHLKSPNSSANVEIVELTDLSGSNSDNESSQGVKRKRK